LGFSIFPHNARNQFFYDCWDIFDWKMIKSRNYCKPIVIFIRNVIQTRRELTHCSDQSWKNASYRESTWNEKR
jgi:hypothetical protein